MNNQADRPDVVFIGAGVNSLGAALIMAEAGWRVLVLDRNETPGGAVRTLELTLPGFHHDIGAMNLTVFANSQFYKDRQDRLARHGVEFVTADLTFGSIAQDGRFLGMSTDLDANLQSIGEFSTADIDAWKQWRVDFDRCAPTLFEIFGTPAARSDPLQYVFGNTANVPDDATAALRGVLLDSLRGNLTRRFESDVVQALIAAWGLHLDYAPDVAGGCWMPFLETNADERTGISVVKGGSGRLITGLVEMIRELGGQVRTSQSVEQILFENGRAVGVRLASGETMRAERAVVASVTPPALAKLAGEQLPSTLAKRARSWRFGPGTMVIHLAMSSLPNWKAGADAQRSFYVHLGPTLDYLAEAYQHGMAGRLADKPYCVVGQPTAHDPSRAPDDGKHVLWVMVRAIPAVIESDELELIQGPTWTDATKEAFADRVLDVIESHAPGLREQILGRTVVSPNDLERFNPNLGGGDLNAGSMHLDQFYGQRPFFNASRNPAPSLYICGASTWPGGGANPASGILVAQQLMDET